MDMHGSSADVGFRNADSGDFGVGGCAVVFVAIVVHDLFPFYLAFILEQLGFIILTSHMKYIQISLIFTCYCKGACYRTN